MTDVIREDLANVDVFQIYTENTAINGVAYVLFVLSDSCAKILSFSRAACTRMLWYWNIAECSIN